MCLSFNKGFGPCPRYPPRHESLRPDSTSSCGTHDEDAFDLLGEWLLQRGAIAQGCLHDRTGRPCPERLLTGKYHQTVLVKFLVRDCIHPGTTRIERTPVLLAARAAHLGISVEEVEQRDFAPDSPRGNAICSMVDASQIGYLTAYLASDNA